MLLFLTLQSTREMLILILLLFAVGGVDAQPGLGVIDAIFPRYGSLAGGTELTILGAGFQRANISGT